MEITNFITRMTKIDGIGSIGKAAGTGIMDAQPAETEASPFRSVFENAVNTAKETEQQTALNTEKLMLGDIDDLHTLGIDNTKAYLSIRLLVEMRNKALDAYNELMRTNL